MNNLTFAPLETKKINQVDSETAEMFIALQARDIYEEAIQTVTTVRDFTQVFDAYAQFEELSLGKVMEEAASKQNTGEEGTNKAVRI